MYRITEHTGHRHVYVHNHEREGTRYTISKVKHENNRQYYNNDMVDDMQY